MELVSPDDPERAAELLHHDGFVAVRDVFSPDVQQPRVMHAVNRGYSSSVTLVHAL